MVRSSCAVAQPPLADGAVRSGGKDVRAIGRKNRCVDGVLVALQLVQQLAAGKVVHPDRAIPRGRCRQPCVRRHGQADNLVLVSLEGVQEACRFHVPYAHDAIIAAGQRQLAAGHERHRVYSAIMVSKAIDQAGARRVGDVPLHHRIVERARQGRAARRRHGNRLDRAAMAGQVAGGQLVVGVGCPRHGTQRQHGERSPAPATRCSVSGAGWQAMFD
jgi:hypothetical protein